MIIVAKDILMIPAGVMVRLNEGDRMLRCHGIDQTGIEADTCYPVSLMVNKPMCIKKNASLYIESGIDLLPKNLYYKQVTGKVLSKKGKK